MSTLLGEARVRIRPDTSDFEKDARRGVSRAASTLGAIAKKAVFASGVAAAAAGGIGLKVAAQMETAEIGFTTMLGSADKADKFLRKLSDFAAKTPFEFPELQSAASSLVAVGVEADRVLPIMRVLGDSTAAMGTGSEGVKAATRALQQMAIKGKVSAEEMLQLAEAGVPAWDALAESLNVTTGEAMKMVSEGKVGVEDLFSAIEKRQGKALKRTEGMMSKQAESLSGLWSTMKDTVQMRLAEAMQPVIPFIKKSMKAAVPVIDGALGAVSSALGTGISYLEDTALPALESWVPKAKEKLADIMPDFDGASMLSDIKAGAIKAGGDVIDGIKTGIEDGNWKPLGVALGKALGTALQNITGLAKSLGTMIKDAAAKVDWPGVGMEVGKQSIGFILGFVTGLLNFDVGPIFKFLAENWFEVLMAALMIVAAPAKVIGAITKILNKIPIVGPMVSWLLNGVRTVGRKAFGWVRKHIFGPFGRGFEAGGPTLAGKFASALEHLRIAAVVWSDDLVKWFKRLPNRFSVWVEKFAFKAGAKFRAFLKKARGIFRTLGRVITDWIIPRIPKMLGHIGTFIGRFVAWIIGTGIPRAVKALARLGAKLLGWILPRIPGMLKNTAKFLGRMTKWIFTTGIPTLTKSLRNLGVKGVKALIEGLKKSDLGKTGRQMLDGLGKGLTALKDRVVKWARKIKDKIVGAIKDLFDIHSPSRVMEKLGGHMVAGLLNGLSNGKGAIKKMVSATFGDPIEFLKNSAGKLGSLIDIPGFAEAAITKVPDLLGKGVKWVKDLFGSWGGGSTAGTQQWAPTDAAALRIVGQPLSLLDTTLRRMNQESGGNKRAINLWDSNARLGIPSKGLMQVIDPTFDAYKHPSLPDNVWNPLSNIVASMRYALARYGSLSAAYNRPGGYDKGGLAPGIGLLPKYTIKPERVLSPSQTKAFEDWMRGEHDAQRSLIGGDLVIQSKGDTREDLGEALFQLRRIQRGGRYA